MTATIRMMKNGAVAQEGATGTAQSSLWLRDGEVKTIKLDITDLMDTGVTVTTSSSELHGASVGTITEASGILTFALTGNRGGGYADVKATLSDGQITTRRIVAFPTGGSDHKDYAA